MTKPMTVEQSKVVDKLYHKLIESLTDNAFWVDSQYNPNDSELTIEDPVAVVIKQLKVIQEWCDENGVKQVVGGELPENPYDFTIISLGYGKIMKLYHSTSRKNADSRVAFGQGMSALLCDGYAKVKPVRLVE